MLDAGHLAPQTGGFEPQRTYHWLVELYGVPGQKVLTLSMQEAPIPEEASDVIEIPFMNETRKVAGKVNYRAGSFVFGDFVDQPTYTSLLKWRSMVIDPVTGKPGMASVYKKTGSVILLGPNDSKRTFSMEGVWPSSVVGGGLSYGNSEHLKITATIEYDKAVPKF